MWPSLCYYPVTNLDHSHYFQEVHNSSTKSATEGTFHLAVSSYRDGSFKGSSVCVGEGIIAMCHVASLAWAMKPLLLKKTKTNRCSAKDRGNPFHLQQNHFCIGEVQKDCLLCNQNIVYLWRSNNTLQLPKCCQGGVKTKLQYKTWTITCHPPSRDSSKGFVVVFSAQPNLFDCWVKTAPWIFLGGCDNRNQHSPIAVVVILPGMTALILGKDA